MRELALLCVPSPHVRGSLPRDMLLRSLALGGLLVALAVGRVVSQRLPPPFSSAVTNGFPGTAAPVQVAPEPGIGSPLGAAVGLGLLGWGAGALAGRAIQANCVGDFCELEGIFYGGAAGGGLGLAVGAHLGNRKRGNFALDVLTSGAVWGLGYALMRSFVKNDDAVGVAITAIALPPTQLVATVLVERATGRSRDGQAAAP
jgi:hypothetical protein